MRRLRLIVLVSAMVCVGASTARAQAYGQPDRGEPGDEMIQSYLAREADRLDEAFTQDFASREHWETRRPQYHQEYLHMLGLWPMPEKNPLKATITGTLEGDGYVVDMLHYQSLPGLYVTGNLWRPARVEAGQKLPAVLYVCGHTFCGRNGTKAAYQSHGLWFARHGYVCLVLDTLQLGEIAAIHHGTYREGRWWWHSRGYTSASVECLNGIRGIDYLVARPDVDPERIAVTGISGGGAATFWIAAADERVKVAVPVSGMATCPPTLQSRHQRPLRLHVPLQHVPVALDPHRVPDRPATDALRQQRRRRHLPHGRQPAGHQPARTPVRLYGAGDLVDSFVSIGGHAYRQDLRQGAYRFINTHLKNDPRPVPTARSISRPVRVTSANTPSIPRAPRLPHRRRPAEGRVEPTIDRHFVPMAKVEPPRAGAFETWKAPLMAELGRVTFGSFPERIPPAEVLKQDGSQSLWLSTEPGIRVHLASLESRTANGQPARILLAVRNAEADDASPDGLDRVRQSGDRLYVCFPRGVGPTRWTRKNPPNYVERSHVLLGRTVDTGRVWDIIATARYLHAKYNSAVPVHVYGRQEAGVLAAYAALWEPDIAGVIAVDPPPRTWTPRPRSCSTSCASATSRTCWPCSPRAR